MGQYTFFVGGIILAIFLFIAVYLYQRSRSENTRSWMGYLLLWPLILDADKEKRKGRFLTTRELLGWGLVLLMIVLVVVFKSSQRH